ncbi:ribosome-associated translation inhibitor RaiA [Mycetocola manganoxydans]|uniref:Ribosome hibernation promoting factor n=1 Tax=Mycetocola manganoxydans TaxID=699879 RepID=A0A3L7A0M3_9MICO|nr:ribosome-associated translation inhibitor RaiA [Mycetocola manganoxydans]RLP73836.1 ribosome-associated translation inhibitor RaiA [Mycetocola manganoxydans]GHD42785.1 ribosomal subunit interface protein [Mycetocola manganoxydans]
METNIVGQGLGLTDRFRDYVEEKSEKIAHLSDRALAFEVKVSRHHDKSGKPGDDRVELMLIGPGPLVRAEAAGSDKYVAFDLAIAKLLEQVRRAKDRKKVLRGKRRTSLHAASSAGFSGIDVEPADLDTIDRVATGSVATLEAESDDEAEYSPVVIREKVFPAEFMTVDEAVDRMELVGHPFFLFVDAKTDRPSVVYRRKGWDYGVIGLDDDAKDEKKRA